MSIDFGNDIYEEPIVAKTFLQEDAQEGSLRPKTLREYIGQEKAKDNLAVFIQAAQKRGGGPGPRAAPRPARPGQDHAGRDHRPGDGGGHPHHLRPGHREARGSGGAADEPQRGGHPLCGRDPPAEPVRGGDPVPGHGGLRPGHHRGQGPQRQLHPAGPAQVHPDRRHHPGGAAVRAPAGPVRRDAAAGAVHAGGALSDHHPVRRHFERGHRAGGRL